MRQTAEGLEQAELVLAAIASKRVVIEDARNSAEGVDFVLACEAALLERAVGNKVLARWIKVCEALANTIVTHVRCMKLKDLLLRCLIKKPECKRAKPLILRQIHLHAESSHVIYTIPAKVLLQLLKERFPLITRAIALRRAVRCDEQRIFNEDQVAFMSAAFGEQHIAFVFTVSNANTFLLLRIFYLSTLTCFDIVQVLMHPRSLVACCMFIICNEGPFM